VGSLPGQRPEELRAFLREAGRALGDAFWAPIVEDAAAVKDPTLAPLALSLGRRVSEWAMARAKQEPFSAVNPREAEPLLRSKSAALSILGARAIRACVDLGGLSPQTLVEMFERASARARNVMLLYCLKKGGDRSTELLLIAGLRDPVVSIREEVVECVETCETPPVLEALRAAANAEKNPSLRELMRCTEALATKGYHIDKAAFGFRSVSIKGKGSVGIPAFSLRELGEQEVVVRLGRMMNGTASPGGKEAHAWHQQEIERWHATQDFRDFQADFERKHPRKTLPPSNPTKRAALIRQLHGKDEGFVDAARFLDGNEDEGSIGCNLDPHPGIAVFRKAIEELTAQPSVSAACFEIKEVTDEPHWPFSDTLLVCTSASIPQVSTWVRRLKPDEVLDRDGGLPGPAPEGKRWLAVWWD
jgi:hypothetical protein